MEPIDAVFRKWRADRVPLNPPADAADLARLEAALGTTLPADVRYYFSIADGMEDCVYDESPTSFWSIRKMLSDSWQPSGSDAHGDFRDLAFADFLIDSWFICFRVRPRSGLSIHVEGVPVELPTLETFFRWYLEDPDSPCLWT